MAATMITFLRAEDVELDLIIPDQPQLARHDHESVRLLSLDLATNGLMNAVSLLEDMRLIAGHGRYLAARMACWKKLRANIYPASLTPTQFMILRGSENLQRTDWTSYEKYEFCSQLLALNPDWQLKDLAEHIHIQPSVVTKTMSPAKCIAQWVEALKAGKVGLRDTYAASQLPHDQQAALLAKRLGGATTVTIEQQVKKIRTPSQSTVKLSRISIPFGGTRIIVTGLEMDLSSLGEQLQQAQEMVRRAVKENLNLKVAQAVWAQRLKAGAV